MYPEVVQVLPRADYTVLVYFADGRLVRYDAAGLLNKKAFESIRDRESFMKKCTVMNGTLAWDIDGKRDTTRSLDIAPDTLYELKPVAETG